MAKENIEMVWVAKKKQNLFVGGKVHKIEAEQLAAKEVIEGLLNMKANPKANGFVQMSKEAFESLNK